MGTCYKPKPLSSHFKQYSSLSRPFSSCVIHILIFDLRDHLKLYLIWYCIIRSLFCYSTHILYNICILSNSMPYNNEKLCKTFIAIHILLWNSLNECTILMKLYFYLNISKVKLLEYFDQYGITEILKCLFAHNC